MTDDDQREPRVWCITHQHEHIARIPRFTYLCKDCGWGQWYRGDALIHEDDTALTGTRHETYEVEHVTVPLAERPRMVPVEASVGVDAWHRGDWMQTFTGRRFYPLSPRVEDIDPIDIAHALSMLCRYNGHVDRFYSVAEHCVLMSLAVAPKDALEALLHDGSEAYVGDMVRPLKHSGRMEEYKRIELGIDTAIHKRFGLPVDRQRLEGIDFYLAIKSPAVKDADTRILLTERTALMANYKPSDRWFVDGMEPLDVVIEAWSPAIAEARWLERFEELMSLVEFDYSIRNVGSAQVWEGTTTRETAEARAALDIWLEPVRAPRGTREFNTYPLAEASR